MGVGEARRITGSDDRVAVTGKVAVGVISWVFVKISVEVGMTVCDGVASSVHRTWLCGR